VSPGGGISCAAAPGAFRPTDKPCSDERGFLVDLKTIGRVSKGRKMMRQQRKLTALLTLSLLLSVWTAGLGGEPALQQLRTDADKALQVVPHSVMDKPLIPPSGDKHDFLSIAPYWWPDPASSNGLPYIRHDGQKNPQSREGTDDDTMSRMCTDVQTLALAYRLTGNEQYAAKAATLLKVWFLDPATKMNPHLEYAQGIAGICTGRGIGIIDSRPFIVATQAIGWLQGSPEWTAEHQQGMKEWFRAYLDWMLTSKNGLEEAAAKNNHESWYLAQTAAYALFVGDQAQARKSVEHGLELIAAQIEPDGRQPLELERTRSYRYSCYNLAALFTLAEFGPAVGVDMFGYRTSDGRSLRAAVDYMAPYFQPGTKWPGQQITEVKRPDEELASLLRRAAIAYNEPAYEEMIRDAKLEKSRFQLLWPR
jgi:hypothetical protein